MGLESRTERDRNTQRARERKMETERDTHTEIERDRKSERDSEKGRLGCGSVGKVLVDKPDELRLEVQSPGPTW